MSAALERPSGSMLPWLTVAAGTLLLLALFHREAGAALQVWSSSTAYGHCFLVAPIAAWLAWERKGVLPLLPPRPTLWPALPALALIPAWLAADLLGIMEGRQLVALAFFQLLALAALGPRLWWRLSPALLYLFFLVPFGAFLTPALQRFTAAFIDGGLTVLGVAHVGDSFQITIPEGSFYVAEACAGLRFLIAAIAFGVLYAVTMFRSPLRRALFILTAALVPVVANGFRGLGIVMLGHVLGSARAGAADHILYGWIFFSLVILALAVAGMPFRQAPSPLPEPELRPAPHAILQSAPLAVVALAAAAPALAAGLSARASMPGAASLPSFAASTACTAGPATKQGPVELQAYRCNGESVALTALAFGAGDNPATILETLRRDAAIGLRGEVDGEIDRIGGVPWAVMTGRDGGAAAYALWFEDKLRVGSVRDRLALARAIFVPAPPPLGLILASPAGLAPLRALLQTPPSFGADGKAGKKT